MFLRSKLYPILQGRAPTWNMKVNPWWALLNNAEMCRLYASVVFSAVLTWKFKMKVSEFGGKWVTKNCQQQSVCLDTAEAAIPAAIPAAECCKALCITTAVTKVVSSLLCSTFLDYLHILKYLSSKIIYCIYAIKSLWLVNGFLPILIVGI